MYVRSYATPTSSTEHHFHISVPTLPLTFDGGQDIDLRQRRGELSSSVTPFHRSSSLPATKLRRTVGPDITSCQSLLIITRDHQLLFHGDNQHSYQNRQCWEPLCGEYRGTPLITDHSASGPEHHHDVNPLPTLRRRR